MSAKKAESTSQGTIILNRKAKFDYYIEDRFEAGVALQGWEVKSLRANKVNLTDSYVLLKGGEAFLFGALITPLPTVSTHIIPDPLRTRKLLLNKTEIAKIGQSIQREGYTAIATAMYWKNNHVKVEIGIAKGKQEHDKRDTSKEREWQREKSRVMKKKDR